MNLNKKIERPGREVKIENSLLGNKNVTVKLGTTDNKNHPETVYISISFWVDIKNKYELSKTILPLGDYTKSQIRLIAKDNKLPVAHKEESFEICFIPDNNYGNYLMETNKDKLQEIGSGDIIFNGSVIGKHKGYPFYTIGQRRGLGVSLKQPLYVKNIIPEKNIIELGTKDEVQNYILFAYNINIIKFENVPIGFKGNAKIRYKDIGSSCVIEEYVNGNLKVIFDEPKTAITPGQSFVMYDDNDVLLGGIIKKYGE